MEVRNESVTVSGEGMHDDSLFMFIFLRNEHICTLYFHPVNFHPVLGENAQVLPTRPDSLAYVGKSTSGSIFEQMGNVSLVDSALQGQSEGSQISPVASWLHVGLLESHTLTWYFEPKMNVNVTIDNDFLCSYY